jgi:hypothetical protein
LERFEIEGWHVHRLPSIPPTATILNPNLRSTKKPTANLHAPTRNYAHIYYKHLYTKNLRDFWPLGFTMLLAL